MFNFGLIRKTLSDYAKALRDIRLEIESLERQREDLLFTPASKTDVRVAMRAWVDGNRSRYVSLLQKDFAVLANSRKQLEDPSAVAQRMAINPLVETPPTSMHVVRERAGIDFAVCGLFGDALLKSIDAVLDGMQWPDNALSNSDRVSKLNELDAKLERLKAEEQKMVDVATKEGLVVDALEAPIAQ